MRTSTTQLFSSNSSDPSNSSNRLMPITPRPDAVMARGAGSYLWDESGKRYLDFIQGWAVNCLGHSPAEVVASLANQASCLISPSPALHNRPQLELADVLARAAGMEAVHFANSGAEANEAAIKLARKWGRLHKSGAYRVISTHNAFHGRTLATMAASGKAGWDALFPPYPNGFDKVDFDDSSAIESQITSETVAILVEPIQGEAGVVVPSPGYIKALRQLCDAHDLLLILDEIQTGIGRTGKMFGFEYEDVAPDILTLGKGLGAGVPLSAVLSNKRAACFEYGDQGGTYNGNPLMAAVGLTVIQTVGEPAFLEAVLAREAQLLAGLRTLEQKYGFVQIRGRGLLYAIKLPVDKAQEITTAAMSDGLLINPARPDVLRFMPSLRVTSDEIEEFLTLLQACLAKHL